MCVYTDSCFCPAFIEDKIDSTPALPYRFGIAASSTHPTMSTTIKSHLPVLVLSKNVYAKRKDGRFYAGSIESKRDDVYVVKFTADSSRECVLEENLTWLAFWDLPEMHWPKRPLVWRTVFSSNEFDGAEISECGSDSKTQNPESFILLKSGGGEPGGLTQPSSTREQPYCAQRSGVVVHSKTQPSMAGQREVVQRRLVLALSRHFKKLYIHKLTVYLEPTALCVCSSNLCLHLSVNVINHVHVAVPFLLDFVSCFNFYKSHFRSSVLRINRRALSRELSTNNMDASLSSRKRPTNTAGIFGLKPAASWLFLGLTMFRNYRALHGNSII